MEEEPQLIKRKSEDEIREEVRKELEAEKKENEVENKKGKIGSLILKVFLTLLFLFVLGETIIGVISINRLNEDKEPVWYINKNTEESNGKKETTYNLGLYVIIKTESGNETTTTLKPFFLK